MDDLDFHDQVLMTGSEREESERVGEGMKERLVGR